MKLILLNGPPRTGKDTAAANLMIAFRNLGMSITHEKFSRPLKHAFAGMMNLTVDEDFNTIYYEANKEKPIPLLGVSFRQWQIDFSEGFMKPKYGDDIFAKLLLARVKDLKSDLLVVSDCGFAQEAETLIESKRFSDILLIRLWRSEYTFANDSRSYIATRPGSRGLDLPNDSNLRQFQVKVVEQVRQWVKNPATIANPPEAAPPPAPATAPTEDATPTTQPEDSAP
jgi:hypothetical protein